MLALFSLLTIITLSIIVVRIGAIAFELTGLSKEVAAFQSQSAFSGVGFTTSEAESIVSHPVRRRIARVLMLLGSAGLTSTIATFILTFLGQSAEDILRRIAILVPFVFGLFVLARSQFIYNAMRKVILKALQKNQSLRILDYQEVLGLSRGYTVSQVSVKPDSWMEGKKLKDLRLQLEGTIILSIDRKEDGEKKFIGAPTGDTEIRQDDVLTCYGRADAVKQLSQRNKGSQGDSEHKEEIEKEKKAEEKRNMQKGYS